MLETTALKAPAPANTGVRAAMFRATHELLSSGNPGSFSIAAIAASAKIAVGSVYNHFDSKDDLLRAFIQAKFTELLEAYKDPTWHEPGQAWDAKLKMLTQKILAEGSPTYAFEKLADTVFDILGTSARLRTQEILIKELEPLLREGIEASALRDAPAHLQASLFVAYLNAAIWAVRQGKLTNDMAVAMVWNGFLNGMASSAGGAAPTT